MDGFYDDLTPFYHLIFEDWDASVARQGEILSAIFRERFPETRRILDVSCGIGTQALALAQQGYELTASDLSEAAVARAQKEAQSRGLAIDFSVRDMREADRTPHAPFDLLICCDNSLPHLLSDEEILKALRAFYRTLRPGGGLLLTLRDYASEKKDGRIVKPYGLREEGAYRYVLLQVWDFGTESAQTYDLTMHIIQEEKQTGRSTLHTMRSRYYAVSIEKVLGLLREAGFEAAERIDAAFYQPVILATRP